MNPDSPDRLAILTVSGAQEDRLFTHLVKEQFFYTVINSTSGLLQDPEICLLVGFRSERLPDLLDVVRKYCRPYRQFISTHGFIQGEVAGPPMVETEVGGARFYLMNVQEFAQF